MPYGPEDDIPEDLNLDNFSPFTKAAEAARLGMLQPKTVPDTTGTMNLPEMDFSQHETQLPGMDFSDSGAPSALEDLSIPHGGLGALSETPTERLARKASEHDEEAGGPGTPKPAPVNTQDDYLSALKRIKDNLSKPVPDFQKGYQEAAAQDASDNNFNRVLGYLSAAIRRAPTADFAPPATHASDFVKQFQGQQSADNAQTDRLEKLATITKPKAGSTQEADLKAQRDYLVKIGAATPEEVASMGPAGLKTVYEHFGLTQREAEKKKEEDQKAKELDADRQLLGKQFPERDFSGLSRQGIGEAASIANADANQALARAQFANTKKQQELKHTEGLPANMELQPGANPAPEQLKDLGTVDRGADEVHRLANRMRAILAESSAPGRVLNPDTKRQLQQIQGEMTVALKDSAKLGQISAGDQHLIDSIRPETTSVWENVSRDPQSFDRQLQGMEKWAEDKRAAAMNSMGARHKGGQSGGHGKVVKETKSVRQYEDGFLEEKT